MNHHRFPAQVFDDIPSHICRNADYIHELEVEIALRVPYAADAHGIAVHQGQHVEELSSGVLLALLLEFETAEGEIDLRILTEYIFLPALSGCGETRFLNYVLRALRIVDHAVAAVLAHVFLAQAGVYRALFAVEVEAQVVVHLVGI